MLGKRTGMEHDAITSMKTEFMQLWDGFMTQSDAHVLVTPAPILSLYPVLSPFLAALASAGADCW